MLLVSMLTRFSKLTSLAKVPDYDNLSSHSLSSREDERSATLARRAQDGDYDEGTIIPDRANSECA